MITRFTKDTWCQGAFYEEADGKVSVCAENAVKCCLSGWVQIVYPKSAEDYLSARRRVCNVIGFEDIGNVRMIPITRWNDAPGRTWEDVEALCKQANIPMEIAEAA